MEYLLEFGLGITTVSFVYLLGAIISYKHYSEAVDNSISLMPPCGCRSGHDNERQRTKLALASCWPVSCLKYRVRYQKVSRRRKTPVID